MITHRQFISFCLIAGVAPWSIGSQFGARMIGGPYADPSWEWVLKLRNRLLLRSQSIDRPKILLIGGSNVLFGFKGDVIEGKVGRPCVVYGLHAGLGADLIAEAASDLIRRGDWVIFMPEWFQMSGFSQERIRVDWLETVGSSIVSTAIRMPRDWPKRAREEAGGLQRHLAMSWRVLLKEYLGSYRQELQGHQTLESISVYDLRAIGEEGNIQVSRPSSRLTTLMLKSSGSAPVFQPPCAATMGLELLAGVCAERGARMAVADPVCLNGIYDKDSLNSLRYAWNQWVVKSGFESLSSPWSGKFEPEDMYDTVYHLNDHGVMLSSIRIADALKSWDDDSKADSEN